MNDLLKLRGSLSSQQNIILTIIGVIILLGLWSLLAHVKSEVRVTQIDRENLKIEDRMYYDNDSILFDNYRNKIFIMKNELHDCYINFFIKKEIEKKDIPFQLKPLVFDLHKIYKQNQTKITNSVVNQYIYNLPEKRLCFVLNYYITS